MDSNDLGDTYGVLGEEQITELSGQTEIQPPLTGLIRERSVEHFTRSLRSYVAPARDLRVREPLVAARRQLSPDFLPQAAGEGL